MYCISAIRRQIIKLSSTCMGNFNFITIIKAEEQLYKKHASLLKIGKCIEQRTRYWRLNAIIIVIIIIITMCIDYLYRGG